MLSGETIPVYNKGGGYVRAIPGAELYRSPENHFKTVQDLVYLPLGRDMEPERMWVQQRGRSLSYLAGHLVGPASGHVGMSPTGLPETPYEAVSREASEELFGDRPVPSSHTFRQLGEAMPFTPSYAGYKGGSKLVTVFVSESDGRYFDPSEREIGALFPMSVGNLKDLARDPSSELHPEFRAIVQNKMVRIGVVGTYSAGKTTLTDALSQRIQGATGITEDVRHYVRDVFGKRGIQDLTPAEFIDLEHMLFRDQTLAARQTDIAVIDSTPIGCPVYLDNYGLLAGSGHRFDGDTIDGWVEKTRPTLSEYDVIVYLPPEIPYENDGFRTGPEFRGPLDEGFRRAIDGHPRVIEVTGYVPGDVAAGVNQRVDQVLQYGVEQGIISPDLIK